MLVPYPLRGLRYDDGKRRPWVAEIHGRDPRYGYRRRFLRPAKDYEPAGKKGKAAPDLWYFLRAGRLYEIQAHVKAGKVRRYFVAVQNGVADEIAANDYNPNRVAAPEMELLRLPIQADGYTQPIVTMPDADRREVIDGFHRNRVGKECPDVAARVHGYLPVVTIRSDRRAKEDRIAATIRHNRARGKHAVDMMSEIVADLHKRGWDAGKIGKELGMDADEVLRLKQITGLAELFADRDFSEAWETTPKRKERMGKSRPT